MSIPKIRLEIENMKYAILNQFILHNEEVEKYVEEEINKVLKDFDFEQLVRQATEDAIVETVGKAIKNIIGYELRLEIEKLVKEAIMENLQRGK